MGIAYFKSDQIYPEEYLTWQIQDQWSLENGVTVPLAYLKVSSVHKIIEYDD